MMTNYQAGMIRGALNALAPEGHVVQVFANARALSAYRWWPVEGLLKASIPAATVDEMGCDFAARYLARELAL
jgi:hypothetical protein